VYDAEGRRIRITLPGQSSWYNVECLYDLEGHCITKNNYSNLEWSSGEVYAAGEHIASYNSGTTFFSTTDWLGTERYRTYPNGTYAESCRSLPFGDNLTCTNDPAISLVHLTGKEHDPETGLDNFSARFYGETAGRFVSPDSNAQPQAVPYATLEKPQTLNLYTVSINNPILFTDQDGHSVVCDPDHFVFDQNKGSWTLTPGVCREVIDFPQRDSSCSAYCHPEAFETHGWKETLHALSTLNYAMYQIDPLGVLAIGTPLGLGEIFPEFAEFSGILREAAAGKGNFGLGTATAADAQKLGEAWVGPGSHIASDGKTLVSADGLRIYRPPSFKPNQGKVQANFERKVVAGGQPVSNGHLDIR
jgi:RHS repeat-associated protein